MVAKKIGPGLMADRGRGDDEAIPEESITQVNNVNSTLAQGGSRSADPDRRKSDWAVAAMTAALALLYDPRYTVDHRLYSEHWQRLNAVRQGLAAGIVRRKRNLRRTIGGGAK